MNSVRIRNTLVIFSLASACVVPVVVGQAGDELSSALREARLLIDTGKPKDAIEKLNSLSTPENPRIAQMLGVAYYHTNEPKRAIEILTPLTEKLPEGSGEKREAIQVLGLSHYLTGNLPKSIHYLEQTVRWAPNHPELSYLLGMAYTQSLQPDKARETFARMFRVPEDSAAARLVTAQMMMRAGIEKMAEAELLEALQKDPKLPQAHLLLGQIAIFRARFDEGVAHMQRELDLNPSNSMALYRMGDALSRQLKWDEAIEALQKSVWLNPFYSAPYILLGKAYLKKELPVKAEGMLRRAVQYDPNNKSAHYLLGQALQQLGRSDEAKREFEIAERLRDEPDR